MATKAKARSEFLSVSDSAIAEHMGNSAIALLPTIDNGMDKARADLELAVTTFGVQLLQAVQRDADKLAAFVKAKKGVSTALGNISHLNATGVSRNAVRDYAVRQYGQTENRQFGKGMEYGNIFAVAFFISMGFITDKKALLVNANNIRKAAQSCPALLNTALGKAPTKRGTTERKVDKADFKAWMTACNKAKGTGAFTRTQFLETIKVQLDGVETTKM